MFLVVASEEDIECLVPDGLDIELFIVVSNGALLFDCESLAILCNLLGIYGDLSVSILGAFDRVSVNPLVGNLPDIASGGRVRLSVESNGMDLRAVPIILANGGSYTGKAVGRGEVDDHLALLLIVGGFLAVQLPDAQKRFVLGHQSGAERDDGHKHCRGSPGHRFSPPRNFGAPQGRTPATFMRTR